MRNLLASLVEWIVEISRAQHSIHLFTIPKNNPCFFCKDLCSFGKNAVCCNNCYMGRIVYLCGIYLLNRIYSNRR